MVIPYIVFLGLYLVAVFIVWLFGAASFYHLVRFGFLSPLSITTSFTMLAGAVLIMFVSYQYLSAIDWSNGWDVMLFLSGLNPF